MKVVVFDQNMVVFEQKWLFWGMVILFGQCGCILTKVVVFGQKWSYSGKNGCIRAR